ncbi:MAG: CstA-like transporter-associated (seleno)protein [Gammaproteobacteria bacterium]
MSAVRLRAPEPPPRLHALWAWVREYLRFLNGDSAYARYVAHFRAIHGDGMPLTRGEFHRRELERRWSGVRRCC